MYMYVYIHIYLYIYIYIYIYINSVVNLILSLMNLEVVAVIYHLSNGLVD